MIWSPIWRAWEAPSEKHPIAVHCLLFAASRRRAGASPIQTHRRRRRRAGQLADLFGRLSIASFLAPGADYSGECRQAEDRLGLSIQTTGHTGDVTRGC